MQTRAENRQEHRRQSRETIPERTGSRSRANVGWLAPVLALLFIATPISAQENADDQLTKATAALSFRPLGPTIMGGRVSDLAVVESDPRIFYVATATGGVWKTGNAGITFTHVFKDEATASVGDVTVAPSNPNVVWVGTGEPQNRQSSPWGNGVYRSTDAGRSWQHLGLENTHHIARIQVHPHNPDVAYVAAVGHLWGANPERGVYKTTDGGQSWERVLYVDDDTGAIDLVMDPGDPQTLFAAMYQRRRRAWGFNGGGPGSGIYRTTDGGREWNELTEGLPKGDKGRIGLDIYRGDGNLIFALVEADARVPGQGFGGGARGNAQNGVYRSSDRGESWEHLSTTNNRPMYYSQIRVDPNDPERIYLGGANLYRSSDGGHNFTADAAAGVHLDHHALWIDPANSNHLILGGDGGVSISWDRSDSWYQFRNLPLAQFYEIGADMRDPYHVCGGLQDNGSWCAPSDTWSNQGIRTRDWYNVGSGDGFFTVLHPNRPGLLFAESQGGNLIRVDLHTGERARIRPLVRPLEDDEAGEGVPMADDAEESETEEDEEDEREMRWNWDTPILLSVHDDNVVYTGSNVVFRSPDLGQSWEEISPDLTWQIDRDTLTLMGVAGSEAQMSRNDGQANYGNLTALAESPVDAAVLYAGSDDGRLHVTRNGGVNWQDITANVPDLPSHIYVTRIVASHGAAGEVFVAFDGHRDDDFAAYVYASNDFGESWEPIREGLPESSVNALEQHPTAANLLFLGNEVGAYFSIDAGAQWKKLEGGLPTVPVDDIVVHPRENDLVLGTHGLGIWIMDDVSPLSELTSAAMEADIHLFSVRRATSYNQYRPQGWTPGIYAAPNPPAGARIRYHVGAGVVVEKEDEDGEDAGASGDDADASDEGEGGEGERDEVAPDSVGITIRDSDGHTVRELHGPLAHGLHEVIWDLRLVEDGANGEPMNPGPRVMPGQYEVAVALPDGADSVKTVFEVRLDPRVSLTSAETLARHEAMLDSYRLSGAVSDAGDALDEISEHLDRIEGVVEAADSAPEAISDEIAAFREALEEAGEELGDASNGAFVWRTIQGSSSPPTADQLWVIDRSWEEAPAEIERINALRTVRLPALYDMVAAEDLRPDIGEPVAVPKRGG